MADILISAFQASRKLGRLAECLLMVDNVSIQATRPDYVVDILKTIPIEQLEQLIDSRSLRLVLDHGVGLASSRRAAELGETEYLSQRIIAEPEDCMGYMVPFVQKVNPRLVEDLEYGMLRVPVPLPMRTRLLSDAEKLPVRFEPIIRQTKLDLQNPAIVESAITGLQTASGVVLNQTDVTRLLECKSRDGLSREDKEREELERVLITRVMRANSCLYEHSLGFCVSGGTGDEAIFRAKLASVWHAGAASERMEALGALLTLNKVPRVEEMVNAGRISISDVVRMRDSKAGRDFRKWFQSLWDAGNPDAQQVLQEYAAMLTQAAKGPTTSYKLSLFGIFQTLGSLHPLLGLGLSAVQEFLLPQLDSKPFLLFDSIRRFVSDKE